ncbi:hypothetical protein D3C79_927280 [compost metagenome]
MIHTRGNAALKHFILGISGKSNNDARTDSSTFLQSANTSGHFLTVHLRHVAVGQNNIDFVLLPHRQTFRAIAGSDYVMPKIGNLLEQ